MVRQAKGARSQGSISFYLVLLQHSARSRFGTFGNGLPRTAKCTNLHPVPKVRKCSGCCCGRSNRHVRKSESARAVVVGVQTATSESPKVLGLLLWAFKRPRPKVRKCSTFGTFGHSARSRFGSPNLYYFRFRFGTFGTFGPEQIRESKSLLLKIGGAAATLGLATAGRPSAGARAARAASVAL